MKFSSPAFHALLLHVTLIFSTSAFAENAALQIGLSEELSWNTTLGKTYQLQVADSDTGPWSNLSENLPGDGEAGHFAITNENRTKTFRVVETTPATDPVSTNPVNGGFEDGTEGDADHWATYASQPPQRTAVGARTGSFAMRAKLLNAGATPAEGGLSQRIVAEGGLITGGESYDFSFWAKQVEVGPSYIQQYQLQWLDGSGGVIGGTGLQNFNGEIGSWVEVKVPNLVAPAAAAEAVITFRFVTGAVSGGAGEVLLDDVSLDSGEESGPGTPEVVEYITPTEMSLLKLGWQTVLGTDYRVYSSEDLSLWTPVASLVEGDGSWEEQEIADLGTNQFFRLEIMVEPVLAPSNLRTSFSAGVNTISLAWTGSDSKGVTGYRILYGTAAGNLDQSIEVGNVNSAVISDLTPGETYFISVITLTANGESSAEDALISAMPNESSDIVALFNVNTPLEPETTIETSTALYTYLADRVRDRHARESQFQLYDHYLSWYWEQRISDIEIVDYVAKGGNEIVFNYSNQAKLNPAEFRTFFGGVTTVAQYNNNQIATLVSTTPSDIPGETDYNYSASINYNPNANRAIQIGDRIEIEISQFLLEPRHGRPNYYGTTLLYIVGEGIVPWAQGNDMGFNGGVVGNVNQSLDSYPLPKEAWLGGNTTLPYQYSNEPSHRFKQFAGNISPTNGHAFMLGRRLHHTDFGNGEHSEPNNPVFTEQVGKLGHAFINRSCVDCHTNNGRALPEPIGEFMFNSVVKVGADASGSPHPVLGHALQPQVSSGEAEGSVRISNYTTTNGQYGDGTPYTLRKPNYIFTGNIPQYFSVRIAQQLVGLGLLEAVSEESILALADPDDANADGISGRARKVIDPETGETRLGRFTHKAGKAKVSHQIATALNNDMGIATTVEPVLDGNTTNTAPGISDADLDLMTRYVALLGVAARRNLNDAQAIKGEALFTTTGCFQCHTPTLTTSEFSPMTELRSQTIHPFTDLLLHDMGPGLASNMDEGDASGSEWRTAPLWNIGLTLGVSGGEAYLHDGRARSLEEAILWHGGEGESAKEAFRNLSADDRDALIQYLKSL